VSFFGYEQGVFSWAVQSSAGQFELLDGGSLYLDDIGELPAAIQSKLLRYFEGQTLQRLGGANLLTSDVRILAGVARPYGDERRGPPFSRRFVLSPERVSD